MTEQAVNGWADAQGRALALASRSGRCRECASALTFMAFWRCPAYCRDGYEDGVIAFIGKMRRSRQLCDACRADVIEALEMLLDPREEEQ